MKKEAKIELKKVFNDYYIVKISKGEYLGVYILNENGLDKIESERNFYTDYEFLMEYEDFLAGVN